MITKNIRAPTGNICIMQGEKGLIEFLSIGDYGKDLNVKADFLGITRNKFCSTNFRSNNRKVRKIRNYNYPLIIQNICLKS